MPELASSLEVIIWYTGLLEIPVSHRGLNPHKLMPMTGVPKNARELRISRFLKSMSFGRNRVNVIR